MHKWNDKLQMSTTAKCAIKVLAAVKQEGRHIGSVVKLLEKSSFEIEVEFGNK